MIKSKTIPVPLYEFNFRDFYHFRGEAAKKEAAQKAEAAAQQEAVMQEFESVGKQETKTTEPSAVSQVEITLKESSTIFL